jgi:hypothetical protein
MQESLPPYEYQHVIEQLDQFDATVQDSTFHKAWLYTKLMVQAHGEAIRTLSNIQDDCTALAWSQFESTFDDDDYESLLALTGIVIHLVNAIPFGQTKHFHHAIEVGFAMARGFTKQEALEHLRQCQIQTACPNTSLLTFPEDNSNLQVIYGGRA